MTTSPNFHIVVPKVLENAYKSVQHFIKISIFFYTENAKYLIGKPWGQGCQAFYKQHELDTTMHYSDTQLKKAQ